MTDKKTQAYEDYAKGMKYADIAEKYGVTESAVKQWVRREWKHKKVTKVTEITEGKVTKVTSEEAESPPRKKGGANNVKHGAYCKVFMDALFEDEAELLDDIATDDKTVLEQTVVALTLRERRLMKEVKRLKEESADNRNLILGSVMKIQGTNDGTNENKTITTAEAVFTALRIYEAELTRVQVNKAKLAVELAKITKEEENGNIEKLKENIQTLADIIKSPVKDRGLPEDE